jgi:hypothetical protein
MTQLFSGDEVWQACKQIMMLQKLSEREGEVRDTLMLARTLDPSYPERGPTGSDFSKILECAERVVPGLKMLDSIEVIKIKDLNDTWPAYLEWSLHPRAKEFLYRPGEWHINSKLLDAKVRSYSMAPGVSKWAKP